MNWSIEDIQSIHSDLSDEEATQFLNQNLKYIEEAAVQAGFYAIENLWLEVKVA